MVHINSYRLELLFSLIRGLDRHFHGIRLACCSREATRDYKFLFDCVALGGEILDFSMLPRHGLMADNADSIKNGLRLSKLDDVSMEFFVPLQKSS